MVRSSAGTRPPMIPCGSIPCWSSIAVPKIGDGSVSRPTPSWPARHRPTSWVKRSGGRARRWNSSPPGSRSPTSRGTEPFVSTRSSPADPRIDQAAAAEELGVPPLPSRDGGDDRGLARGGSQPTTAAGDAPASPAGTGSVLSRSPASPADGGSRGDRAAGWPAERATWSEGQHESRTASTAGTASGESDGLSLPGGTARRSGAAAMLPRSSGRQSGGQPVRPASTAVDPLAAAGITGPVAEGQTLEYRGRPLHLARSRRFAWDYEIPAVRRAAGALRAELWTTRDGGVTWQKTAVDADGRSPIDVDLGRAWVLRSTARTGGCRARCRGGPAQRRGTRRLGGGGRPSAGDAAHRGGS